MAQAINSMPPMAQDMHALRTHVAGIDNSVQGMQQNTQQLTQQVAYMGNSVNSMSREVTPTMKGMRAFMPWKW